MHRADSGFSKMNQQVLEQESEHLEELQAQAVTYVRSHAVDEVEAQTFLDMLGLAS
jgi:hypothetical protein